MGGSPTLANLGNDHEFISKEYISMGMRRPFGEVQTKTMRADAQSGQYTIVESCYSSHKLHCMLECTQILLGV